ncbi:hypothetical protein AVEN_49269-1, partial [Araneus ventricosus]
VYRIGLIRESSEFEEGYQENIQYWLECDVDDPGFQVLEDDGIIAIVIDDQDSCDDEVGPSDNDPDEKEQSSVESFHCPLEVLEQEEECHAVAQTCLRFSVGKTEVSLHKSHISHAIGRWARHIVSDEVSRPPLILTQVWNQS